MSEAEAVEDGTAEVFQNPAKRACPAPSPSFSSSSTFGSSFMVDFLASPSHNCGGGHSLKDSNSSSAIATVNPPFAGKIDEEAIFGDLVSVIMPVHNASTFLEEALNSVLHQTYRPLELVCFDDGSTDNSWQILEQFVPIFEAKNVFLTMVKSSREQASGPGYARNQAVRISKGIYLCHLDADDIMRPERVSLQHELAVRRGNRCLVGCNFDRIPEDSTPYYTSWLNSLSDHGITIQQFRECTIICPSWFMHRDVYRSIEEAHNIKFPGRGAYVEAGRDLTTGKLIRVPEDTFFFMDHLEMGGTLAKVEQALVTYRFSAGSWCTGTSHSDLFLARLPYIERRILTSLNWTSFTVWGYGKDGKKFAHSLGKEAASKITAFCDVDPNKIGMTYFITSCKKHVPVIHFLEAKPPIVICVASKRANSNSNSTLSGLDDNIKRLGLSEGVDYFHFC